MHERTRGKRQYRGNSLIRSSTPLGPYRGTMHRALWWSQGVAVSYERCTPVTAWLSVLAHPPKFKGSWALLSFGVCPSEGAREDVSVRSDGHVHCGLSLKHSNSLYLSLSLSHSLSLTHTLSLSLSLFPSLAHSLQVHERTRAYDLMGMSTAVFTAHSHLSTVCFEFQFRAKREQLISF